MKKLLFSALAVMAFGFSAQAQQDEFPIFGIKAGANLSNFAGDGADDTDGATSFYAGVTLDIPMIRSFHFQPELQYSVEGADKMSMTYFRVPAMAKFYFGQNFNVLVGPVLGVKMDTEDKFLNKQTKAMDYGAAAGLSYELNSGFLIEARYYLGLEDINRSNEADKITNTSIQLGLGYRF
jgi:Outer membrane protein beta-barrel domain